MNQNHGWTFIIIVKGQKRTKQTYHNKIRQIKKNNNHKNKINNQNNSNKERNKDKDRNNKKKIKK